MASSVRDDLIPYREPSGSDAKEVQPTYKKNSLGLGNGTGVEMKVAQSLETKEEGPTVELPGLIAAIQDRFQRAETFRFVHEQRWMRAYRNYRGIYGPDMTWREHEKSRVFVKITKTKVLAAYGQLIDVIFGNNTFPIGVEPSQLPEGIADLAHIDPKDQGNGQEGGDQLVPDYGFPGDGKTIPPGASTHSILGSVGDKLKKMFGKDVTAKEGPAPDPKTMVTVEPALMAAKRMEKLIKDQLDESDASVHLRHALFESCLLGSGVIKGPFNYEQTVNKWEDVIGTKTYVPYKKTIPKLESVSLWNSYPDPDAMTLDECEFFIERHCLSRSDLRNLQNRPLFNKEAISTVIERGHNYTAKWWETFLIDNASKNLNKERFEVLEYWGTMDRYLAEEVGLEIPEKFSELNEVQINAWICGNVILRIVINPFTPSRIPYLIAPYEINPYTIFGIGVPENMEDTQAILNGHARMAIDNLALAGNVILEVDSTYMTPGTDMKLYPGKIFERQSGQPGTMINAIKMPNTAPDHMSIFDRFRQLADEQTGIPSYSHGQTGVQSTTRTASGMSMLMGASALNIKTVVKNIDDFVLGPLGTALYHWNMQFSDDPEIVGDLEIKARGMASLMQREVRSQRLSMFAQMTTGNPVLMPLVNWTYFLQQVADSLELDREKIIADPEMQKLYAMLIGQQNGQGNSPTTNPPGTSPGLGAPTGMGQEGAPSDTQGSGNGTIGTGSVPMPGSPSFSSAGAKP